MTCSHLPEFRARMQAFGWATIAGFSAVFAVLALFFVWAEKRVSKGYRVNSAEQFNTAGRQVGTGLIATDIVRHLPCTMCQRFKMHP